MLIQIITTFAHIQLIFKQVEVIRPWANVSFIRFAAENETFIQYTECLNT